MQVIFDTGSAWAWLFSEKCGNDKCPAKNGRFHQTQSKEFKENEKAGQALQYGKGKIVGHPAQDRACFSSDDSKCIHDISFLTVVNSADLEALRGDGLIGLAPTPNQDGEMSDPLKNGVPGFITQLKNSEQYKKEFEAMFSIYLSNDEQSPGKITFGGYDMALAANGKTQKDVYWVDQSANEAYWAANGKNIKFGKTPLVNYSQQLILDNGMSLAMAPKKTFLALMETLLSEYQVPCQPAKPLWAC